MTWRVRSWRLPLGNLWLYRTSIPVAGAPKLAAGRDFDILGAVPHLSLGQNVSDDFWSGKCRSSLASWNAQQDPVLVERVCRLHCTIRPGKSHASPEEAASGNQLLLLPLPFCLWVVPRGYNQLVIAIQGGSAQLNRSDLNVLGIVVKSIIARDWKLQL